MPNELRTFEDFQRSLRCFDWMHDLGFQGSDVDQLIERHGRFLLLEAKRREGPQVYIALGQYIALRALAALPQFTVLLIAEDDKGKEDESLPHYSVLRITPDTKPHVQGLRHGQKQAVFYTDSSFQHWTLSELQTYVKGWYENDEHSSRPA